MQGLEPLDRAPVAAKPRACHNCRRRRLRCDRSFPSCRKCAISGEDCLGYGTLLRWANAPAVRGKLVGQLAVAKTGKPGPKPVSVPPRAAIQKSTLFLHPSLRDPLLDGLNRRNRHYVHHCKQTRPIRYSFYYVPLGNPCSHPQSPPPCVETWCPSISMTATLSALSSLCCTNLAFSKPPS